MAAALLIPCYGAMPSDASAPAHDSPVSRLLGAKGPGRTPREQALEVLQSCGVVFLPPGSAALRHGCHGHGVGAESDLS